MRKRRALPVSLHTPDTRAHPRTPRRSAAGEDWDSAPAAELVPRLAAIDPDAALGRSSVTCLAAHAPSGRLWAGTSDGKVHCWQVPGGGGAARWAHAWAAHGGKVKAMAVSPWGRLFTGAARAAAGAACA